MFLNRDRMMDNVQKHDICPHVVMGLICRICFHLINSLLYFTNQAAEIRKVDNITWDRINWKVEQV
jgi:hypothetical protein